jgi:hypothetical protein
MSTTIHRPHVARHQPRLSDGVKHPVRVVTPLDRMLACLDFHVEQARRGRV